MYALAFPAIDPIALELGPLVIRWYSLAYVAGILLGWRYIIILAAKSDIGVDRGHVDDFIIWATLGIILGGRFGYVIFYNPGYFADNPLLIFAMWQGGMSFHGGLIGVILVTWVFVRKKNISFLTFGDMVCAAAPIGLFFGRIANFINGELYGRITDVPWAMVFPRGGSEPRHPSQLYEAGLEGLLLFCVIAAMIYRFNAMARPGLSMGVFMAGYGLSRYIVEFVREPDAHLGTLYGIATMGQLLSLPLIIIGAWLIHRARRQP
ncbi:MAG: prolipoprotein diacylglyceryl transferase [Rhodospirillaceae bacterium]|nr:prolipoprotein diacylglyceryl transferase [Rhodospirillaceae bacterium]|tara:strand:- start:2921 stop:3712 length:792 start_codon:yes stop_codon:yes gene_type:complete